MKRVSFLIALTILTIPCIAQYYDLIITSKGDSIACYIDSTSEKTIFFRALSKGTWTNTHMNRSDITTYQEDAISKKSYAFKHGTSVIQGKKMHVSAFVPKNSILLANDHIFSLTASYERIQPLASNVCVSLRAGTGLTAESGTHLAVIGQASALLGRKYNFLEAGVAYYHNLMYPDAFVIPLFGYRFVGKRGLSVKVYATHLVDLIDGPNEQQEEEPESVLRTVAMHVSLGYRLKL
ncbi:hypothetical protein ACFLT1_06740 [Bacteroidota bacterium]